MLFLCLIFHIFIFHVLPVLMNKDMCVCDVRVQTVRDRVISGR